MIDADHEARFLLNFRETPVSVDQGAISDYRIISKSLSLSDIHKPILQ